MNIWKHRRKKCDKTSLVLLGVLAVSAVLLVGILSLMYGLVGQFPAQLLYFQQLSVSSLYLALSVQHNGTELSYNITVPLLLFFVLHNVSGQTIWAASRRRRSAIKMDQMLKEFGEKNENIIHFGDGEK